MAKIDLHVHSKHSEHPSDWFLQRVGAKESYTEPEYIYQLAKKRGMDFVTLTDHNRIDGALLLKEKYPEEVLIGVESTTYFPEDGCKAHVLFYGIDEKQFAHIQSIRENIFILREFIKSEDLAYSLAHATYSVNGKLKIEHIEKLILLFDVFEGINGGRNYLSNNTFLEIMRKLSPDHLEMLYAKHGIEPMSDTPWIKAFTAGSDDHSGQFIGKTFTLTEAKDIEEALENIKRKKVSPEGRHNDYKSLAFSVYKIAYEFSKTKGNLASNSMFQKINENLFEAKAVNLRDRIRLRQVKNYTRKKGIKTTQLLIELIEETKKVDPLHIDERLDIIYAKIAAIADEFFKKILMSIEKDLVAGDVVNIIMSISSSIPGLFMSLPFFSALKHTYQCRDLVNQMQVSLGIDIRNGEKKILWFTDTLNDLNGVSETLKELGWISYRKKLKIFIVSAELEDCQKVSLPPNVIYLPTFFKAKIPSYEDYTLKFPSILKSIDILQKEKPTEIYVSTPGPIGLLGLLMAKMLNIPANGIYHTDFTNEVDKIAEDHAVTEIFESYTRWFYSMMDTICLHTQEYINLLETRGLDRTKLNLLPKGIDPDIFSFKPHARKTLGQRYGIQNGINLLYAGRVSKDKNLDFLIDLFRNIQKKRENLNLMIVGKGPYLDELKRKAKAMKGIFFTGRVDRKDLVEVYSASDLFLFPSTTDTFGMVVMEAQACELPAIVSDTGGPKEIIIDGVTGKTAKSNDMSDWIQKLDSLLTMKESHESSFQQMKKDARKNVLKRYSWESVLDSIMTGNGGAHP